MQKFEHVTVTPLTAGFKSQTGAEWPFGNICICPLGQSDFCALGAR